MKIASFANSTLSCFGVKLIRVKRDMPVPPGNTYRLDEKSPDGMDVEVRKLLNLVAYTTTNDVTYNGRDFPAGYHTLRVGGYEFKGQRDPERRLHGVPFNFDGASVLDLGCNQGGMLRSIADRIRVGVGVDYDHKKINAANRIKAYNKTENLQYYVFDLERENLELLGNFITTPKVDIVFMLSMCAWIKNWEKVINRARSLSDALLFESHGTVDQRNDQEGYVRKLYPNVVVIRRASTDDPTYTKRALLLCSAR